MRDAGRSWLEVQGRASRDAFPSYEIEGVRSQDARREHVTT